MSLPSASTRLQVQAGSAPSSTDLIAVWGCCVSNADNVPRLYSSTKAMTDAHGYCEAAEYVALHMQDAAKPVLFVPLAISTAGTVGRFNASGNTGSSVVSCAAGGSGALAETDGELTVITGGTIGTDQIVLGLSLDGGETVKPVRLGTASSYTIPNVGLVLSFAAGTLVAGDTALTWHSTAPLPDFTALAAALAVMGAQNRVTRSWLFVGDLTALNQGQGIQTQADAYETTWERYVYAKAQVRDRLPQASLSQVRARTTGVFNTTFLEVGATGDTITRSAGSFVTDGFVAGDTIRVTGSASNNVSGVPASFTATVITLNTTDLANEGPVADVVITSEPTLTFDATGDTITRNRGSWLADGFRVGDSVTISGTVSNNVTKTITALSATVMTFASGLVNETIGSWGVSIVTGETDAVHVAAMNAMFATITSDPRVDLGLGRLRKLSPITGYSMRRPVQWADSIRSYQRDLAKTTWEKAYGALKGWSIEGEHDERVDGGALDARFTCARTWSNGPDGAFIAMSVTRAEDGNILGMTHNAAVANLAQTVIQRVTEGWAGRTLVLNPPDSEGKRTAKKSSLAVLKSQANEELRRNLLSDVGGEGQRASGASWTPATDDDLGVANATLHGTVTLDLNGTIVHVATVVSVR